MATHSDVRTRNGLSAPRALILPGVLHAPQGFRPGSSNRCPIPESPDMEEFVEPHFDVAAAIRHLSSPGSGSPQDLTARRLLLPFLERAQHYDELLLEVKDLRREVDELRRRVPQTLPSKFTESCETLHTNGSRVQLIGKDEEAQVDPQPETVDEAVVDDKLDSKTAARNKAIAALTQVSLFAAVPSVMDGHRRQTSVATVVEETPSRPPSRSASSLGRRIRSRINSISKEPADYEPLESAKLSPDVSPVSQVDQSRKTIFFPRERSRSVSDMTVKPMVTSSAANRPERPTSASEVVDTVAKPERDSVVEVVTFGRRRSASVVETPLMSPAASSDYFAKGLTDSVEPRQIERERASKLVKKEGGRFREFVRTSNPIDPLEVQPPGPGEAYHKSPADMGKALLRSLSIEGLSIQRTLSVEGTSTQRTLSVEGISTERTLSVKGISTQRSDTEHSQTARSDTGSVVELKRRVSRNPSAAQSDNELLRSTKKDGARRGLFARNRTLDSDSVSLKPSSDGRFMASRKSDGHQFELHGVTSDDGNHRNGTDREDTRKESRMRGFMRGLGHDLDPGETTDSSTRLRRDRVKDYMRHLANKSDKPGDGNKLVDNHQLAGSHVPITNHRPVDNHKLIKGTRRPADIPITIHKAVVSHVPVESHKTAATPAHIEIHKPTDSRMPTHNNDSNAIHRPVNPHMVEPHTPVDTHKFFDSRRLFDSHKRHERHKFADGDQRHPKKEGLGVKRESSMIAGMARRVTPKSKKEEKREPWPPAAGLPEETPSKGKENSVLEIREKESKAKDLKEIEMAMKMRGKKGKEKKDDGKRFDNVFGGGS